MNGQSDRTEAIHRLLEAGVTQYLDAAIALRAFRQEIQRRARRVVLKELETLRDAIGIDLKEDNIIDYANPEISAGECDGTWAWIAVRFQMGSVAGYFGMVFERDTNGRCVPWVTVAMDLGQVRCAKFVIGKCQALSIDSKNDYRSEVSLRDAISAHEIDRFEEKLRELVGQWARVWKSIGGVKSLPIK